MAHGDPDRPEAEGRTISRHRRLWSRSDRIRQGTGPLDNLVVLVVSLVLLTLIGGGLAFYVYRYERPPTATEPASPGENRAP